MKPEDLREAFIEFIIGLGFVLFAIVQWTNYWIHYLDK